MKREVFKANKKGITLTVEHPEAGMKRVSTDDGVEIAVFIAEPKGDDAVGFSVMTACSLRMIAEIVRVLLAKHPEVVLPIIMAETMGRAHKAERPAGEPLTLDRLLKIA